MGNRKAPLTLNSQPSKTEVSRHRGILEQEWSSILFSIFAQTCHCSERKVSARDTLPGKSLTPPPSREAHHYQQAKPGFRVSPFLCQMFIPPSSSRGWQDLFRVLEVNPEPPRPLSGESLTQLLRSPREEIGQGADLCLGLWVFHTTPDSTSFNFPS